MSQSPPILVWQPGGGVPVGPISNPPVYSQAGTTALVEGQAYVDVVFGSIQTDDQWVFGECMVVNELDVDPLNIWPGIITDKAAGGFRLQLNGMPDSGNYYLHWAVSGINITPSPASTYLLTGPATGGIHVDSTAFTVSLPPSTTVEGTITVTPDDGASGSFTPVSVDLTSSSRSATFVYTPDTYGAATISVTNSGGLIDPAALAFTCVATGYGMTGPTSGDTLVASTDFTVDLPGGSVVIGTVTVTPSDGGDGGTFTPTTIALTTAAPSATFTYTPASIGEKTISVANDGGLTNPGNLTYTSLVPGLSDGDRVSTWADSSVNGRDGTQSGGARPVFKTNIINGKPVVRFVSGFSTCLNITSPYSGALSWTVFAVMKPINTGAVSFSSITASAGGFVPQGQASASDGNLYTFNRTNFSRCSNAPFVAAFHVYASLSGGVGNPSQYVDGTFVTTTSVANAGSGDFDLISNSSSDGDLAELILYDSDLGATDRANIEKYLGTKYAITVAGGTAVDPTTVTGLAGWWEADSL